MGFMNIFSRRSPRDLDDRRMKSQPYDATYASVPPLKGTYPIAGNRQNMLLENYIASQAQRSQAGLSQVSVDQFSEYSAPAPFVPRFHDEDIERPSSAPNGGQTPDWLKPLNRPKRETARGPPVPMAARSRLHSVVSRRDQAATSRPRPPTAETASLASRAGASSTRSHAASLRSESSMGFVDLLDAHSEIRPATFRHRIEAAGIRDYGEDVADRNIGENGLDLDSSQVRAFYAATEQTRPRSRAGVRLKNPPGSPRSPRTCIFPERTSSRLPAPLRDEGSSGNDFGAPGRTPTSVERRRSVSTTTPPLSGNVMNTSRARAYPTSMHEDTAPARQDCSKAVKPAAPQLSEEDADWPPEKWARSGGVRGDSASSLKETAFGGLDEIPSEEEDGDDAAYTTRPTSARGGPASSTRTPSARHGAPRQRRHTATSSMASSVASRDTIINLTPLSYPRKSPQAHMEEESAGANDEEPSDAATAQKHVGGSPPPVETGDGARGSRNAASVTSTSNPDEIGEHVPARTSSARHWSFSSAASGTASTTDSNPFARPPSRHTADTSVDSYRGPSSQSSLASPRIPEQRPRTATKTVAFDIDDHLSSTDGDDDDESPRRPRGEGEEDLLFKPGFGLEGAELPGILPAPRAGAPPPPGISILRVPDVPRLARTPEHGGARQHRQQRRYILDTAADDSDSGSESGDSFRGEAERRRRGMRRLSALGAAAACDEGGGGGGRGLGGLAAGIGDDVIEEEDEEGEGGESQWQA